MTSDGLATAFNVMGWEQTIAVAEQEQLAVFLIRRTEDGFEEYASPEFDKLVTVHSGGSNVYIHSCFWFLSNNILAMAVGYLFQKKSISGSCGGLVTRY